MNGRGLGIIGLVLLSVALGFAKGYQAKEIEVRPAAEYAAHQNFQNIVIGARCFTTDDEIRQIFDSKKLFEKGIMPVLVVVQNNNEFAVRIEGRDIFFVDREGTNLAPMDPVEVMLQISLKKPLSSYSTRKEILLQRSVDRKMVTDFQRKIFDEKLIPPTGSDFGVVFFPLPEDGDLKGTRLYFPTVENMTDGEELMFFEFDLQQP